MEACWADQKKPKKKKKRLQLTEVETKLKILWLQQYHTVSFWSVQTSPDLVREMHIYCNITSRMLHNFNSKAFVSNICS